MGFAVPQRVESSWHAQSLSQVQLFVTPWAMPVKLLCPSDSVGKSAGVGCHFLFQGIFLTQASDLSLLHWQVDSLPLYHQGNPTS